MAAPEGLIGRRGAARQEMKPDRKATRLPDAVSWSVHQPSPAVGKGRKGSKGKKPLVSFPGSSGVKCPQHKSDPQYGRKKARGKWKARVCRLTCISPVLYRQWLGTSGQERGPGEYRFDPASGQAGSSVQVTVTGANFATGATLAVGGPGVEVSNVKVASSTEITATFTIAPGAGTGVRGVTVSMPSGNSNLASFRINPRRQKG